jgi:hypothetical protein
LPLGLLSESDPKLDRAAQGRVEFSKNGPVGNQEEMFAVTYVNRTLINQFEDQSIMLATQSCECGRPMSPNRFEGNNVDPSITRILAFGHDDMPFATEAVKNSRILDRMRTDCGKGTRFGWLKT